MLLYSMDNPYHGLSKNIWIYSASALVEAVGYASIKYLPLYLITQLQMNVVQSGKVLGLFGFMLVIGVYVSGVIRFNLNALTFQRACLALLSITYLSFIYSYSINITICLVAMLGVVIGSKRPAALSSLVSLSASASTPKAISLCYQMLNLGIAMGMIFAGLLTSISYFWLFILSSIVSIISFMMLGTIDTKKVTYVGVSRCEGEPTVPREKIIHLMVFSVLVFYIGTAMSFIYSMYPIYLKEMYYITNMEFGIVISVNGALIVLFQVIITSQLNRSFSRYAISLGSFILLLGYFILPFSYGFYYALLSMVLITLGEMISIPFLVDHAAHILSFKKRESVLVGFNAIFQTPMLLTPLLGSYVYEHYSPTVLWIGFAVSGMLMIILFEATIRYTGLKVDVGLD